MSCPDDNELSRFASGGMEGHSTASIEAHLDTCADCRRVVAAAALASGAATSGSPVTWEAGSVLGRYRIERLVGAGAMGVVYAAHDPQLDRRVALKVLRPNALGGESAEASRGRVLAEAQAMARLSHPNVVGVFDLAEADGEIFLAMELSLGLTLDAWLRKEPRSQEEILRVFIDAAAGLCAAHKAGVIHRDFKPQNVLIDADGRVRVSDFGLARTDAWRDDPGPQTGPRVLAGTPCYMAPEQFEGHADAKSDQFSFCIALYEALSGTRPFTGATVSELKKALSSPQEPIRPGSIPGPVFQLLRKGLARDPGDRFADMEALLQALRRVSGFQRSKGARRRWLTGASAVAASLIALGLAQAFWPPQPSSALLDETGLLRLEPGEEKSLVVAGVQRVAVGDPRIAEVRAIGNDELRVIGTGEGRTTLLIWTQGNQRRTYLVSVSRR